MPGDTGENLKFIKEKGEVKMRKILIGAVRSKGDFKEGKRKIKYDNIKLYLADYRDFKAHGFSFDKNFEPIKVKTVDFEEITGGISVKEFLKNFEKEYMFHKVRVISEENDFGRDEVIELKFSEKLCFVLHKELEAKKKLEIEDFDEDEDEDEDFDEDEEDDAEVDDEDFSEEDSYFDLGAVDKSTGEVFEKDTKKGKRHG